MSVALFFVCTASRLYGYALEGNFWPSGSQIAMRLELGDAELPLKDGSRTFNNSAADALALWNQLIGSAHFTWSTSSGPGASLDGVNSVFFSDNVFGQSFGAGAIATTISTFDRTTHIKVEADVIVNTAFTYDSYRGPRLMPTGPGSEITDIHRVLLHEFGHVLGLAHPEGVAAIMNAFLGDLDHLTADDTAGAQALYGPPAVPGNVSNVSTRLPVGAGDNVLIEGFIVQGPAGATKKIIVRAIGPSLAAFGITDALANPTLEIHDSNNNNLIVATNDDWKVTRLGGLIIADQSAEITASGLAPGNDFESAIIANLPPGSYTAVVRGLGDSVGTGVVDAFDLNPGAATTMANIATRGLIQPGDKLLIGGFIIQNGAGKAAVLAIGPSLAAFGITNALPDTTLQLRDGNGNLVVENDDWKIRSSDGASQQAEIEATGLQPTDDRESAVVTVLPPGPYTAQVRGKPETTGTGVVQVYFLR
jgi:hypothetical protein